jgi:protein TonB
MKKGDDKQGRERKFLELPEYPGGKEAFQKFIRENLRYPAEALEKRIEGEVHLRYWVEGNGKVSEAEVTHGIGYGCDEEALRLVKMLKYGTAKNRGLRVKSAMRTRISFKLPVQASVQYQYSVAEKTKKEPNPSKTGGSVSYTIRIPLPPSSVTD